MIEELKRVDLVKFMERCWQTRFKEEGHRFVARSPFREEKSPSLYVSREKDGHWVFFDHGSGSGGTIIDAVMSRDDHTDTGLAIGTAARMAQEVGLLSMMPARPETQKKPDLEGLFRKLCRHDVRPVRDYLIGRCISPVLVDQMISSGVVALNRVNDSTYCCFAVRDAKGQLRSLFNRKIEGKAEREKFLLGEQYPFCLDWGELGGARRIHLCEGIVDAMSLLTLEDGACVLAIPGVHHDLRTHNCLPPKATLVEALDDDEAGRAAAKRLSQYFPGQVIRFDLKKAHDVNELLCGKPVKLSTKAKIAIAQSSKSSRELAAEYGVHHSRICKIRSEADEILEEAWAQRRRGRKPKARPSDEVKKAQQDLEKMTRQSQLQAMRIEWLELEVEIREKRIVEAARKGKVRKKKAKLK